MKKMIVAIALGVLFSATMFAAKGGPASESVSVVSCSSTTDSTGAAVQQCTVNVSNLASGKTYQLDMATNCSTAPSILTVTSNGDVMMLGPESSGQCPTGVSLINFTLYLQSNNGSRLKQVAFTSFNF